MSAPPGPPGLVVSALRSGAGKTTVALALLAAFARRGLRVQPFKCGPDYIDPAFHAAAAGRPSLNLDPWAMGRPRRAALAAAARDADLALAEGAMGLFDGPAAPGPGGPGSTAEVAAAAGWPALLVLDVSGQAQSAAACALGAMRLRPDVAVAGAVLNRVASPRHGRLARAGLAAVGLPVFGEIGRDAAPAMAERHLGLVQAEETGGLADLLARLADLAEGACDLDAIRAAARVGAPGPGGAPPRLDPPGQRVALARDAAFSFVYPHLTDAWRAAGAEIATFSPLADEAPPDDADACWLPGGYPELHAGRLAAAGRFRAGLSRFAATRPVHGECGGYMALGAGLVDADGARHEMAGLLGLETSFARRRLHLGYRRARLLAPMPGAPAGALLVGHEFHYATVLAQPDDPLAAVTDAEGAPVPETGSRRGRATGGFFHLVDGAEP
jgi:cobyrinic acid a,c-diamide synthase